MSNSRGQVQSVLGFECGTVRQHFNHLRNDSHNMQSILSWGGEDRRQPVQEVAHQRQENHF